MGRSDNHELVAILSELPAFAGCNARDLADLAQHARRSSLPARWPLIHEETPADACYILLEGSASVTVGGKEVATLGRGAVVGEMALASGRLRNAAVMSTSPLDLVHIDADQFALLLERRPALRAALLSRLEPEASPA